MAEEKNLTPGWAVYADGRRLDTAHEGSVISIRVDDRLNGIGSAVIRFDMSSESIRSAGILSFGSETAIHVGYKDALVKVFSGKISGFKTVLAERENAVLAVTIHNALEIFNHGGQSSGFERKTAGDIIRGIAGKYGVSTHIDAFGSDSDFLIQPGNTDLDSMLSLASLYGKDVYFYENTLYVSDTITVRDDDIVLEWGKGLIHFESAEDTSALVSEWAVSGLSLRNGDMYTDKESLDRLEQKIGGSHTWADAAQGGWTGVANRGTVADSASAKAIAAGQLRNDSFRFCTAFGETEGNPNLSPGMRVVIKSAGDTISGEYIAQEVTHTVDANQGYRTGFVLKRNMSP